MYLKTRVRYKQFPTVFERGRYSESLVGMKNVKAVGGMPQSKEGETPIIPSQIVPWYDFSIHAAIRFHDPPRHSPEIQEEKRNVKNTVQAPYSALPTVK